MTPILPPLTEDEIEAIYAQLRQSQKEVGRGKRVRTRISLVLLLLIYGVTVWLSSVKGARYVTVLFLLFSLLFSWYTFPDEKRHKATLKKAHAKIENREDARCLDLLFEILYTDMDEAERQRIFKLLVEFAKSLSPETLVYLTQKNRNEIRSWLMGDDYDRALAAIHAMTVIGDKRAVPILEKLASRDHYDAKRAGVNAAAEAALPRLRERITVLERGEELLRPSSRIDNGETLVRPASSELVERPETMLRASAQTQQSETLDISNTPS